MSSSLDDSVRTLFKSGGFLLVGFIFELGFSFLGKLFIARELSPSDFGSITLGLTLATFGATFVTLGLHTGVARYLPRYDSTAHRRGILITAFTLAVPLAALLGAVIVLGAPFLANTVFDTPDAIPVFRIFGVVAFLMTLNWLVIGVTRGLKRSGPRVVIDNIVLPVSRFGAVVVVILAGVTAVRFAWAYAVSWILAVLVGVGYLYRYTSLFDIGRGATTRYRELVVFSLPLLLSSVISLVFQDVDKLMLGYFRNPSEVGVYDVAYSLGRLMNIGEMAFGFVFMPLVSELHSEGRTEEFRRVYQVVTKWIVVITLPPFLAVVMFPERIISLSFGPKYSTGALALSVVATGFLIHSVAGLNNAALTSIGKTRLILAANTVAGLANVGLNLVLIPRLGLLGAGIATTVTFVVLNAILSGYLYWEERIVPIDRAVARLVVITGVLAGALYLVARTTTDGSTIALLALAVVFLLLYVATLLRFGAVESEEVMLVKSVEERFGLDLGPIKRIGHRVMGTEPEERKDDEDA